MVQKQIQQFLNCANKNQPKLNYTIITNFTYHALNCFA